MIINALFKNHDVLHDYVRAKPLILFTPLGKQVEGARVINVCVALIRGLNMNVNVIYYG